MKPRILLMEDEANFRQTLAVNLELEGYAVRQACDGKQAMSLFDSEHFDLCILDVMVPEVNGLHVCEHIRVNREKVPILFLSALNMTQDRLNGLRSGADDYVGKPFHLEELLIKVSRLIRKGSWIEKASKSEAPVDEVFSFGENKINLRSYEAVGVEGGFTLTKKEADLMRLFIEHPNEVIGRERMLNVIWGYTVYPYSRSIDNFLLNLRNKFEPNKKAPVYFHSIRGVGYRFTPDGLQTN